MDGGHWCREQLSSISAPAIIRPCASSPMCAFLRGDCAPICAARRERSRCSARPLETLLLLNGVENDGAGHMAGADRKAALEPVSLLEGIRVALEDCSERAVLRPAYDLKIRKLEQGSA